MFELLRAPLCKRGQFKRFLVTLALALLSFPLNLSAQTSTDSESVPRDSENVPRDTAAPLDAAAGSIPDTVSSISLTGPKTLQAVRIESGKINLDGELNEPEWQSAELAAEFIQNEPFEGQPASEPTKVRLLYDKENLYIGAICYDSAGEKGFVSRELKRDFSPRDNDIFQVVFDTFNDKRNSVVFAVNPAGAVRDMQTSGDGGSFNSEWDAVWDARTRTTADGWEAEFVIPFKSLRFDGSEQNWGMNFERRIRRKNEATHWSPIPRPHRVYRVSMAGSLEGVTDVQQGRNLYIKPYVSAPIGRAEGDDWDFKPDAGLDIKYGVTSKLTLDLTLNTDFSQVEADDAQINFTRFSLFFPEKREFFLENQQVFEFGNVGNRGGGRRRGGPTRPGADLIPFFSRRIGISDDGDLIPILGGARMTGRLGSRYTLGLISMQSGELEDIPSTNFTVGRFRRDVLRNSDVGVIFVNKAAGEGDNYNRTYGADFNFRFFDALELSSYFLKSSTSGLSGDDSAGFFRVVWQDRLLDLEAYHISIDDNFNAEVGFVPRTGIKKTRGQIALTPRPEGRIPWIREFRPSLNLDYITNQEGEIEGREVSGRFTVEFNDSSRFSIGRQESFERLFEEDEVLDHLLEPGDYGFGDFSVSYSTDSSRMFSAFAEYRDGDFYDGQRSSRGFGVDFSPSAKFLAGISWDHGDLEFPNEAYSTELVSSRIDYNFNTRMFVSSLIQYSSRDGFVASNIRFRWIHRPLSDFYLVYNERRTTQGEVLDRALIAKLTYLFSF
ncbi:MAG: carbohydrate binding family 9 domain-containing protein [Acidobacteriota bacterium]|nr:MAG: carbohydrate binding family 9 domain-containing protein [Acidobacteriota bacterium]